MSAIVLATFISQRIAPKGTIYTLKLRRRGVDLSSPAAQLPRRRDPHLKRDAPLAGSLACEQQPGEGSPSLGPFSPGRAAGRDAGGTCGTVSAHAVAEALADGEHDSTHVGKVADLPPELRPVDPVDFALQVLDDAGGAVPVLDPDGHQVVRWLSRKPPLTPYTLRQRQHR